MTTATTTTTSSSRNNNKNNIKNTERDEGCSNGLYKSKHLQFRLLVLLIVANVISFQQRNNWKLLLLQKQLWRTLTTTTTTNATTTTNSRILETILSSSSSTAAASAASQQNSSTLSSTSDAMSTSSMLAPWDVPPPSNVASISSKVPYAVHDNSSWIGDQWIPPPGFRLFSVHEMQNFFLSSSSSSQQLRETSMLFLGDSSARRLYATFFAILNVTAAAATAKALTTTTTTTSMDFWDLDADHIIDVNKHALTEVCTTKNVTLCRSIVSKNKTNNNKTNNNNSRSSSSHIFHRRHHFDYLQVTCPESILNMDLHRLLGEYQHIIIHIGAWHLMMKCRSKRLDDFKRLIQRLEMVSLQKRKPENRTETTTTYSSSIVWVTMGSIGHEHDLNGKRTWKRALDINSKIRLYVEDNTNNHLVQKSSRLTILDWGSVMQARSWPYQDRIHGDIAPHYGLDARLVLIQMLMNHMRMLER